VNFYDEFRGHRQRGEPGTNDENASRPPPRRVPGGPSRHQGLSIMLPHAENGPRGRCDMAGGS
jgi:hypothetical protein